MPEKLGRGKKRGIRISAIVQQCVQGLKGWKEAKKVGKKMQMFTKYIIP